MYHAALLGQLEPEDEDTAPKKGEKSIDVQTDLKITTILMLETSQNSSVERIPLI
jgi:hypothetical protein